MYVKCSLHLVFSWWHAKTLPSVFHIYECFSQLLQLTHFIISFYRHSPHSRPLTSPPPRHPGGVSHSSPVRQRTSHPNDITTSTDDWPKFSRSPAPRGATSQRVPSQNRRIYGPHRSVSHVHARSSKLPRVSVVVYL